MRQLYEDAEFIELRKSYRSTYEIISFAKQILSTGAMEAIERHDEPPEVIHCHNSLFLLTYFLPSDIFIT